VRGIPARNGGVIAQLDLIGSPPSPAGCRFGL
jgi:hypothetical protein